MAQHDYVIANASGAAVRADLNNALSAVVTLNSGAAAPTPTYAYMLWPDTTAGLLKQRNAANTDWVTVGTLGSLNLGNVPAPSSAGTADQVLATDGSGVQSWVNRAQLVQDTVKASTSGTAVDFTGIPSWAKKIVISFSGVSTSGTSPLQVQLGDAGGVEVTGYSGITTSFAASSAGAASSTAGVNLSTGGDTAAMTRDGQVVLANLSGNTWTASGGIAAVAITRACVVSYAKSLSDTLDRVRITAVNGTDTFDAGSINIIYEG